ncbi:MAG: mechanosensitive ion channel [Bdellovibrionales bacterium]|nr:mechanosensitive ion channel [Bdellovibrionales bacterium]
MMSTIQERLQALLGIEQFVLLVAFSFIDIVVYKIFLRNLSAERHQNLRRLFKDLFVSIGFFTVCWVAQYWVATQGSRELQTFYHYFGVGALLTGAVTFVRATKIIVSEYLFFNSMKAGVPVLLVNLVTIMLSIFIAAWISTSVFGVRWAPLLATSAILSVVLGLALQDTLGNLFAGVALQFDKPYEIGDWVEVHTDSQTYVGEVYEITWRATTLYGLFDEVITVSNRVVAGSQISNYSARKKPIYRGLTIYLDVAGQTDVLKAMFAKILKETPGVLQNLEHYVMLRDLTEKGAHWRLFYPIIHYSKQFIIVDDVLVRVHRELAQLGIEVSRLRVDANTRDDFTPEARA